MPSGIVGKPTKTLINYIKTYKNERGDIEEEIMSTLLYMNSVSFFKLQNLFQD
jgi:cephalosporin-C deacetylase-like acetyl esterase